MLSISSQIGSGDEGDLRPVRISASGDQVSCDLSGEFAVLRLKNGIYYGLSPLCTFIWSTIKTPITENEIRDKIFESYNVDA